MGIALDRELKIVLHRVDPPPGVAFAIQRGRGELHERTIAAGDELVLSCTVRVLRPAGGAPDFKGPFVQGKEGERFLYVNSGTLAGQPDSPWTRRAKVWLKALPLDGLPADPAVVPEIHDRIPGRKKDGGPACASTSVLEPGWTR